MSEFKLISPMLDNFIVGGPMSDHHGVRCYPAMENGTDDRYIVKVISVPGSSAQLDALLLTGAFADKASALDYFKTLADGVLDEVDTLEKLAELEGFIPYASYQLEPMESGEGYNIYLLRNYLRTLQKHFKRHSFTHLDALNLGLDLCAALSVCRRNGYLYVDLKPENVFVSDQRLFRIGDLGFIRIDSLKYASVPEKYLSAYTPPEIRDAFSALNTTMDTYAAGLILYQTYNNGELPIVSPGEPLPAPLYADYEMSEIILKACAPNPDDRWQDPMQMGQAIISYMQRNGAEDIPIVPMPSAESDEESEEETAQIEEVEFVQEEIAAFAQEDTEEFSEVDEPEEETALDEDENLSFLEDESEEEMDEAELTEGYDAITEEVTEILEQADELAAAVVPEPVVVPDHVDVPMPEIPAPEEEPAEDTADTADSNEQVAEEAETEQADIKEEEQTEEPPETKKHHWVRNAIIALLVLVLLAGGILFYKNYYLLPIEIVATEGNKDTLTVFVETDIDETLLEVICADTYGNQLYAPVVNGQAEFTGLVSNTAYNIRVMAHGFHRLTGRSKTAYSTPIQTTIVQFDAIAGASADSVILNFTVEGPDCEKWTVVYTAEGEEERTATFNSHLVTLTDLTVGKDYTFRLLPGEERYIAGEDELTFTTRELIKAENLQVVSCINNTLTVQWRAPAGETVSSWSVRCSNENYNQTVITSDTTATFEGLDHTQEFTVEVKAVGMSVGQVTSIAANSITASNFTADISDPTKIALSWDPSVEISEDGWLLRYSIVGIETENTIPCTKNAAVIAPVIPNATYRIQLENVKGAVLLGSKISVTTDAAKDFSKDFSGFHAVRSNLEFNICRTPSREGWGRYDLSDDDYTSAFTVGEKMSFLVRFQGAYNLPTEDAEILYVIRNQDGAPVCSAAETKQWSSMWNTTYCKLSVPVMPATPGTYAIEVYFDSGLAHAQEFTLS